MIHTTQMPEFGSKKPSGSKRNTITSTTTAEDDKPVEDDEHSRCQQSYLGDDLQQAQRVDRRHSWSNVMTPNRLSSDSLDQQQHQQDHHHHHQHCRHHHHNRLHPSAAGSELANALWGRTFQGMSEKILPTGTVREALEIMADSASKTDLSKRRSLSPSFQSMLKLKSARLSSQSTNLICACIRQPRLELQEQSSIGSDAGNTCNSSSSSISSRQSTIAESRRKSGEVILFRRDEAYDLELIFDRAFDPEVDRVDLVLQLDDQLLRISGINVITVPISTSPPGPLAGKEQKKSWWAGFIDFREVSTIRFHVSHSARIGKWRMNVVTRNKKSQDAAGGGGKGPANTCLVFERVHIAMNPRQIDRKAAKSFHRLTSMECKET